MFGDVIYRSVTNISNPRIKIGPGHLPHKYVGGVCMNIVNLVVKKIGRIPRDTIVTNRLHHSNKNILTDIFYMLSIIVHVIE